MAFEDDDDEDGLSPSRPTAEPETALSPANIIQSYTALLILGILSDDYSRLDRASLLRFVARCQNNDGS
jgi:geranylgeranyl transferase type-1 subunit beta